jgi:DNA polymerase III delta prime subunit
MALTFDDDQAGALLQALGLPNDTNDLELAVQTATDLASQVADTDMSKTSTVAAAARRNGGEYVDNDTIAALRRDANEGRRIAAAAARAKVETAVEDAVNNGKITAARRKHWETLLENDPAMADVLAAVPNETAVPLHEVGHSAQMDRPSDTDHVWFYG